VVKTSLVLRRAALAVTILAGALAGAAVVLADPNSPITITNVDNPDPVSSGQQLTYTITMVNTGGSKLTELVMSDQLNGIGGVGVPPQLQITSTRGSCTQNANLVRCTTAQIEGNGTWVVTIRGLVNAASGTTINNTATVTGTRSAQNFTSTATATTFVSNTGGDPLPDLNVAKAGPTSVAINAPITYTLTVNNIGTAHATGVKVVDTVPAGVTGIAAAGTSLFTCGVAGQTVTCTGGAINQGSNGTITITGTTPAAPTTLTNTASVDPDNVIAESNELNNTSALVNTQVTATPAPGNFSIVKTDDGSILAGAGPDPVTPGGTITYKILVTNTSNFRADDVVVVDGTQGLVASSVQASQVITGGTVGTFGGCVVTAPETRCSIRTLNPGGTMLVTVSGEVVQSAGSSIFNTATVSGNIKNTGYSATDTERTTVKPSVDLTITKSDTPDPVCARSWPGAVPAPPVCRGGLTYNFVVGNSGIQPATGVVVRDPLPPGTVFDGFVAPAFSGGCAVDAGNVVTCTGGTLAPESTTAISFVLVAPATLGAISNTAVVDPNNAIFEADEANNTATQGTQVATGIDLTVSKVDSSPGFDPIATNGTQTWTITVDNIGTQDATGVRVRDTLPAGTIFRSAVADNGFTCSHQNGVVECVGGAILGTASEFYPPFGAPGNDTATIVIRAFARPFVGTGVDGMHNEVRVDPLNEIAEANEANNIEFEDTDVANGGAGMGAFNQLTITKTQVSPANNVARNAVVTYQIVVGNDGTDPAVGVVVRDFPPAGSDYIEMTGSNEFHCVEGEGAVNCTGGQIPAGGNATLTLKVFAPDTPGTYTNQAIVDPGHAIPEGNETDNTSSVTTIVENGGNDPFNDLRLDKDGTASVSPGGTINYTLKVFNTGSNAAQNVTVRDVLPAGTVFVSAEDAAPASPGAFSCSHSSGIINCTGGTLNAGEPSARFIAIQVTAPNQQGTLTNQAVIDPENAVPEGDESNNFDTFDTAVVSKINLKIEKSGPTQSSQGSTSQYVITVTNEAKGGGSGEPAFGVRVVDPLPVALIPLAVTAGGNYACTVSENPINLIDCIGDLFPGDPVTITVDVFMTGEGGRSLDNEACVDPDDVIEEALDPGESDNCSTHSAFTGPAPKKSPNLFVSKSAEPSTVTPGQALAYTVLVQNNGDARAHGPLTLTDTLSPNVTFVDANGTNGWTCSHASGTVTCHESPAPGGGDGLDIGASATITINVTVNNDTTLPITNVASIAPGQADPTDADAEDEKAEHLANNTATATTSVGGSGFDLSVTSITDNPDPVNRSHQLKWTIVAVNGGTAQADAVKVRVTLPVSGITLVGADGSNGFNCAAPSGNVFDCTGDLPGSGNTVITVTAAVNLGAPDDLNLTATIDPDGVFAEADEGNNSQDEVTTVSGDTCTSTPCIDLVATQLTASIDPIPSGSSVTFNFTVVNIGDTPTSLVPGERLLHFDLSGAHTSFARASSNPAIVCVTDPATTANVNLFTNCEGNLGPGEGVTITVTLNGVTGASVSALGLADPFNLVPEFIEPSPNNTLSKTVTIQP
jgi:uncharacterized repeat protein (TIGR01451 family)